MGNHWENKVEHIGAKKTYNPEGVIIIWQNIKYYVIIHLHNSEVQVLRKSQGGSPGKKRFFMLIWLRIIKK